MNVLYDGRVFQVQRVGGISRYFLEVISRLPISWTPMVSGVDSLPEPVHPKLRCLVPPSFRPSRVKHYVHKKWWRPKVAGKAQILHPTYYDLSCGFKYSDFKCPVIITVYDLVIAKFASMIEGAETIVAHQRAAIQRADKIICISHSTERDLLEFFPQAVGKTVVIHLGAPDWRLPTASSQAKFENPTFLFVGNRSAYKNFFFVLGAFAKAVKARPNIRLHIAGPPLSSEECWQIYLLGLNERISFTPYPSQTCLKQLYLDSVALLYPSCYEGFGIPPLEAMTCDTIPVTSNTTSLPEVMGDAGIMLSPRSEDVWVDCIIKLSKPFQGWRDVVQKGRERLKEFSWDECSRKHISLYDNCL